MGGRLTELPKNQSYQIRQAAAVTRTGASVVNTCTLLTILPCMC